MLQYWSVFDLSCILKDYIIIGHVFTAKRANSYTFVPLQMSIHTWILTAVLGLLVVHSTAGQSCPTPFEAVISGVTDVVIPAVQFDFQDPEMTFLSEILHLTNEEIEQKTEYAIQHFNTTFGLDFSNIEPNDEQQRFLGNARFRPSRGPYNFTIVDNRWLVSGNPRSRCFKVGFGGFGVDFTGEMMLHGTYGGEEGIQAPADAFMVYQDLFFFDVCPQQPILIQYKSLVPARVLSFDGGTIGIEEHQLNSRQLGTGRVHIVTKARPRPDDSMLLVVENTIVLSFP